MPQRSITKQESTESLVELWGGVLRVRAGQISDIICLRISARSPEAYENQHQTGQQVFQSHPDAAFLTALPDNVFERGPGADDVRRRHHVVPIDYASLPFPGRKTGLIGYAYVGGSTLFLFIMDSAVKSNLPALPGDTGDIGRNAFTEVVIGAAVALYKSGSVKLAVRFAYWSRMDRDEVFGSKLREVVRRNPGMTLWSGAEEVSLHSASARLIASVKSGESSSQVITLKESTFVGRLNALRANRWDRPEIVLPYGYRFARQQYPDGSVVPIPGVVEVDASCRETLVELVGMAANGKSWAEIGQRAAERQIPLRSPHDAKSGRTFADLEQVATRTQSARLLLGKPEIIALWRTGTWTVRRICPLPGVRSIREYVMEFLPNDQYGYVDTTVTWPLPEGGWGVDDATWERLLARVTGAMRTSRGRSGVASAEIDRRPLGGMTAWVDGDHQLRLAPDSATAYRLRRRPVSESRAATGRERGWFTGEGEIVATFHATSLHNSLAFALEEGLLRLVGGGVELGELECAPRTVRDKRSEGAERAANLEAEALELEAEAAASDGLARVAMREGSELSAVRYVEEAEESRRNAAAKRVAAERLRVAHNDEAEQTEEVDLDLTHPAVVVGALRRFGQNAPPVLARAVAALGITEHFRMDLDETGGLGRWTAICEVPVVGGEGAVSLHLAGTVPNTHPSAGTGVGCHRSHSQDMAFKLLVDGRALGEVAQEYHRSEDWVRTRVTSWLKAQGMVARSLPLVILDCPIPETRRVVFALCAGDDGLIADIEPSFVEHLRTTYLSARGWGVPTWAAGAFRFERRLLATLLAVPGCVADKKDLAGGLNVSMRQLSQRVKQSGRRVALVERPEELTMRPVPCPHSDCPGPRWASHVLVTPETPGGLLCPVCRRTPDDPTVVFSPAYLEAWEGPVNDQSKHGRPAKSPTTMAAAHALPVAIRGGSMLTSGESAQRLGWSEYQVRQHLEPDDMVGRVRLYESGRIDRMVIERDCEVAAIGDLVTVSEAATRLGIAEHRLRLLIEQGVVPTTQLGPTGVLAVSTTALELARSLITDVDLLNSTTLSIGEAARRAGVTITELRNAADRGLVEVDRTWGNTRRFTVAAIDAFQDSLTAADTDTSLLAIGDAARLAGVSQGILRTAEAAGRITCVRTRSGHRRFRVDDVMSYAAAIAGT